jgi:FkbM family methyltransferase
MNGWKYVAAGLAGLGLFTVVSPGMRPWAGAMISKGTGAEVACDWNSLASFPWKIESYLQRKRDLLSAAKIVARDEKLGLIQVATPARPFWVKAQGQHMDGVELVAMLLAEREFNTEAVTQARVRQGDVVLDVGAHIGTFADFALRLGASKVIMLEPDPVNVECIQRNFPSEIASGKVILIPEGAWSKPGTIEFSAGLANSGTGSMVNHEAGAQRIHVPVRPIDGILAGAGIERVNFIKMDIEGAESEALKGAAGTLKAQKPRIMLDANHRGDDFRALPALIASIRPGYVLRMGGCECDANSGGRFNPHTLFFE